MRRQWNIPSKLVSLLDDRLNSRDLGYTRTFISSATQSFAGCATTSGIQHYPGV